MAAKSYFSSISTGYFSIIIQLITALLLTPFILSYINKEQYGVYTLAISSIQFLGMFNFGFGGALGILASRNTSSFSTVSGYSSVMQTFQLLLGIIGFIFGLYLSWNFSSYFEVSGKAIYEYKVITIVFSVSFFITMLNQVYSTLLVSFRKIAVNNRISILTSLLGSALVVLFLLLDYGIIGLSISLLITQILTLVLNYVRVRTGFPEIKVRLFKFDKSNFKDLYKIGFWLFIGSFSVFFIEKFDQFVVGKLLSIETVSVLVITAKTFELARKLIYLIPNNFRPYFGKLIEEGELENAKSKYNLLFKLTVSVAIFMASVLIMNNSLFIHYWVGDEFYGGNLVSCFLGLNLVYYAWKLPSRAFLSSHLVVKEQSIFGVFEGAANVLLSIFLGFQFGLVGIVAGTFLSGFVFQILFYGYLLNSKGIETVQDYINIQRGRLLELLVFSILVVVFFWLQSTFFSEANALIFALIGTMTAMGLFVVLNLRNYPLFLQLVKM